MKTCTIDGCGKPVRGHGLCNAHLLKQQRHGSPTFDYRTDRSPQWAFYRQALLHKSDDCLLWPYARKTGRWGGYGLLRESPSSHRKLRVHILVCEAVHGPKPSDAHQVAHNCGRPACINPCHLRWATPKGNSQDRTVHGTDARGEKNYRAKMTESQVLVIRASNLSGPKLAEAFGVRRSTIQKIRRRERWAHL